MRRNIGELSLKDAYKAYLLTNPKDSKYYVTKSQYLKICYSFNKKITKLMIEEGEAIHLPFGLSTFSVKKYKTNYKKPIFNYKHWRETGEKTFIINDHSDDYSAYIFWNKYKCMIKNKRLYNFKIIRGGSRELAKIMKIKNGHKIYNTRDRYNR